MDWRAHVTSIGLTIAAAGALVYAYADRGSVTEAEKKTREGDVFVAWRRENLTRVVLDHGAEHIVLERTHDDAGDAEWWMRAPLAEKGNAEACDKLASAFELASVVRKVAPDVAAAGLDAPRARGEIDMGSVTYRFALGGDAPTPAGAAYLRVDGVGTVVVSRDFAMEVLQGADTYRSRSFVPYVSVQLSALEVKGENDLRVERGDDVSFKLMPSGLRASRTKLDTIWGALGEMRVEAFLTDAVAEPLVAHPVATITMTPAGDGARARSGPALGSGSLPLGIIRVGGACPDNPDDVVVVRDGPTHLAACAPKGILGGLATTEGELIDTHLFAAHDDEVAELRIEALGAGGPALEIARKESGWREKAPVERDLPEDEVTAAAALVKAIAGAEGADPETGGGTFEPKWRVTLHRADGDAVEVVEVGAPDAAGDVVARRAFDGARLHVGAATARKLMPRAVALRGADIWTPRIEGVPVEAIETRCDGVTQSLARDGDQWTMVNPAGYAADNSSVLDLIDEATRAKAAAWVADGDDGHFGFDGPECAIALRLRADGGERVARLELGRAGEGGIYARLGDAGPVFVAPTALRDVARTWLIDLHGLAPPNVAAVTLARDAKHLAYEADAGAAPDETTEAVLAAANVLRADSVLHLGPARADEGFAHPSLVVTLRTGEGSGSVTKRVVFGAEVGDGKARYARVDGTEATYSVNRERLRAFFERF